MFCIKQKQNCCFYFTKEKKKVVVNKIVIDREETTRVRSLSQNMIEKKNTQNSILIYVAVYLTMHFLFQVQHKFILIHVHCFIIFVDLIQSSE